MQRLILSTDDVPEKERFSYWREAVGEGLLGTSAERNKDQGTPFNAHVVASIGGSVARFRIRTDGYPVFRRPRDIARRSWDGYVRLYRELSAGVRFDYGARELTTGPGDLLIGHPMSPFATVPRANYDSEVWLFPRRLFDPHLPASRHPRSLLLSGDRGLSGMVKAYLDAFAGQLDALDDRETGLIADNFCRLLAAACGANASEQQEAVRLARLEEAKSYVRLNLADPDLTPEKTAAALRISLRQLHLLFEPSGESFARHVTRRRLEECRAALLNPIGARSVTDIALGWGFNSVATFHRNFRRAFGATASDLRAQTSGSRSRG